MNRNTQELRILTGIHAGARAPLPDGEATIGTSPSCDFVVTDEGILPEHARLTPQEAGWTVHWSQDSAGGIARLAPGAGLAVGPVLVTVSAANAPWPDELPPAALQPETPPAPEAAEARPVAESPVATLEAPAVGPGPASTGKKESARPLMSLVLGALLAALLTGFALMWASRPMPASPTVPAPAAVADPDTMRARILAAITELGLQQHVAIEPDGKGGLAVRAVLVSDEQAEALATAMLRLSPRPLLQIATEGDLRQAVSEAVDRLAIELQANLTAIYLGQGRFRIDGRLTNEAEREGLLSNLRAQFPQVAAFESGLVTPESAAGRMVADLQAAGIAQVQGRWQDARLWLDVRLAEIDIPRWEQALARVSARHNLPFSAQLEILPGPPAGMASAALPFRLHSVVSGATPYVVLADGTKVLTGGNHLGWQLVEVSAQRVVFEGAGGRRAEVPR